MKMQPMTLLGAFPTAPPHTVPPAAIPAFTDIKTQLHFAETMAKEGLSFISSSTTSVNAASSLKLPATPETQETPMPASAKPAPVLAANETYQPVVASESPQPAVPTALAPAKAPIEKPALASPETQRTPPDPPQPLPVEASPGSPASPKPLAPLESPVEAIAPNPAPAPTQVQPTSLAVAAEPVAKPIVTIAAIETKPTKPTKETKIPHAETFTPNLQPATATTPQSIEPQAMVAVMVPTQPLSHAVPHETKEAPTSISTVAVSTKTPPLATPAPQPLSPQPNSVSAEAPPTDHPVPEASATISFELEQAPLPIPIATITSLPITPVEAPRKPVLEAAKPTPQKPLHETTVSSPSTPPTPPAPAVSQTTAPIPTRATTPPPQETAAAIQVPNEAHPKLTGPNATLAATQPTTSPSPIQNNQPTLPHTTLQATPTVLEVGVPNGSHGWLTIRAEIDETGAVQASLSPTTSAARETLHHDLPAMTSFLANEQLSVQLHVAEPPSSSAASTNQGLTQNAPTPNQNGGNNSRQQEPVPEAPESEWSTAAYEPATLHGGSWLNVVA